MPNVVRKTEAAPIDGTPDKRLFWSIISDYNLQTGLCELIDNALDVWTLQKRKRKLKISVELDSQRQLIAVQDNAGGVPQDELRLLIAPGGSRNLPTSEIIGVFGVGSKRASVALGEHIEIRTRCKNAGSFQLDVTKEWLQSADWEMASYSIPDFEPNTTRVEISQLRQAFDDDDIHNLAGIFGEIYAWFIVEGVEIKINDRTIDPLVFDNWSYPPKFPPRQSELSFNLDGFGEIYAQITGGLIRDRNPETENYGVYFYCNHRLISKEVRTRDVGYNISSEAGVPHPDASLSRIIVEMQGPVRAMPWNSSKTAINYMHTTFLYIRPTIVQMNSYYSSLSRRLKNDWQGEVFKYPVGTTEDVDPVVPGIRKRMVLPDLPKVRKSQIDHLKAKNKKILEDNPWTLGLVEAIGAVDVIKRQKFQTKNRISLIILDSNFEISLKEFIVHREELFPIYKFNDANLSKLFRNRSNVLNEILNVVSIPDKHIKIAKHYYAMRNKLIHERATLGVTDSDIESYRATVEAVLKKLFKLKFSSERN